MTYQIIVHGGANDLVTEDIERKEHCEAIVDRLEEMMKNGASALDVCEAGVMMLEDDEMFNSGTGAYLQTDGKCRMDASIMDSELRAGAVIQIENVKNPISVARKLLDKKIHSVLSGAGAHQFALEQGFASHNGATPKQIDIYKQNLAELENDISYSALENFYNSPKREKLGTVGCVVRDSNGLIAAGTSTGGLRTCFPGRVGDSPLIGCGNYANELVGVSCTGVGEKIMRVTLARTVSFYVEQGLSLQAALEQAMGQLEKIKGDGGIIAISKTGEIGYVFNTKVMSFAQRCA
jgi:beta-aspartyl-peptidase (threonine type)